MATTAASLVKPVTAVTRIILILAALLAIVAGIQLYILTDYTKDFFAWTIAAPLSAAFLGAGYFTGATLLLLGAREAAWANVRIAMAAVCVFIPVMLVATFMHLDRFHFNEAAFGPRLAAWAWMVVYVAVPFLVIAIFYSQMHAPGADPSLSAPVAPWLRGLIGLNAVVACVVGVALVAFPKVMIALWGWTLTPLTSRVVGGGFLAMAAGSVQFIREGDWPRTRIGTIPYMLVGVLQLVAVARYPGKMDWNRPGAWMYVLFMVAVLIGGLYSTMLAWKPSRKGSDLGPSLGARKPGIA